ncbi:MAG: hypothetical protein JNM27_00670 [Leptospirales bacterium]|nr:hypothetical protein [Leptospirales bacterium]
MKRRYLNKLSVPCVFIFAVLTSALVAQEEEKGKSIDATSEPAQKPDPRLNQIEVQAGVALSASGSIIASSEDGITLLERLINSNALYAPRVSPIVRQIGPYYRIPPFQLSSRQFGASYERLFERFSFGGAFRYTDVSAGLKIPESFVPGPLVNVPVPVITRVTPEIQSRKLLACSFQLEGVMSYHFNRDGEWDPFLRTSAGVGRGWVAGIGYGPYLNEVHATVGAGMRWNLNETTSLSAELNTTGYWIVTGPSSFIDRTDVLINPGKGSIYIVRVLLGAGYRY